MMKKSIRIIAGFGMAVIMSVGMLVFVPNIGIATAYAAETVNETAIRVGLPNSPTRNRSEFVQRYGDYTINYNGMAYTAVEFFDTYKGYDFGIIRTTTGRNKAITVTLRHGATVQATTPTTPAVTQPTAEPTAIINDSVSQPANVSTPLGREGYASDIEYLLSDEYTEAMRQEFYRLINEYRQANGLRELEVNSDLQAYADIRADEQRTRFGHTRPNGSPAGSGWHNSKNHLNTRYAENAIGVGALSTDPIDTAASIFENWKNSPGHNNHMLYCFDANITMAFGIVPKLDEIGMVTSGAIFATGF